MRAGEQIDADGFHDVRDREKEADAGEDEEADKGGFFLQPIPISPHCQKQAGGRPEE